MIYIIHGDAPRDSCFLCMANETYLKFRTMLQGKRIGFIRLNDLRNESEIIECVVRAVTSKSLEIAV